MLITQTNNVLERVAVHAVPIGIGGEAEGAVRGLSAAAITEKRTSVAGDLISGDGDVLEDALLYGVVVGIKGGDGEFRQHVILGVRECEDVEGGHTVGDGTDFGLLRVDAAVAVLRAKGRGAARVVELKFCYGRRNFIVGQELSFLAVGTNVELGERVTGNLSVIVRSLYNAF